MGRALLQTVWRSIRLCDSVPKMTHMVLFMCYRMENTPACNRFIEELVFVNNDIMSGEKLRDEQSDQQKVKHGSQSDNDQMSG